MTIGEMNLMNQGLMSGITRAGMAKNPSLYPLHFCTIAGGILAFGYLTRLATQNPDACWDRTNNPYPWQKLGVNGQYKFWSAVPGYYKSLKAPEERPNID